MIKGVQRISELMFSSSKCAQKKREDTEFIKLKTEKKQNQGL